VRVVVVVVVVVDRRSSIVDHRSRGDARIRKGPR
jgi:hypothetical protein